MDFRADLHIHSCLSPCASLEMSPNAIVEKACARKINCLALTDHNSAGNCAVMQRLCASRGILFFPGLEVTTAEEAHVLCLFPTVEAAMELDRLVYSTLPDVKNDPLRFGDQVLVNELEEVEGFVEKYLGMASKITVDELRVCVMDLEGVIIAAHIDRPSFSIISQLGFLSGDFSAVEISRAGIRHGTDLSIAGTYPTVSASDSHFLHEIGSVCIGFDIARAEFGEYRRTLLEHKTIILTEPPVQKH